jgi:hypothetical protein
MARSASSRCERPGRLRAARNMPPVISTIVMSRFFARRQRTSMSAYFTNSLTPPTSIGLLASPFAAGTFPVGQRAARSLPERWPALSPAGVAWHLRAQGHQLAHREGAARSLPLTIGSKDGRQNKRQPSLACRLVAVLRRRRLDQGSRCFRLGLCRAHCRCRPPRREPAAPALTWIPKKGRTRLRSSPSLAWALY